MTPASKKNRRGALKIIFHPSFNPLQAVNQCFGKQEASDAILTNVKNFTFENFHTPEIHEFSEFPKFSSISANMSILNTFKKALQGYQNTELDAVICQSNDIATNTKQKQHKHGLQHDFKKSLIVQRNTWPQKGCLKKSVPQILDFKAF